LLEAHSYDSILMTAIVYRIYHGSILVESFLAMGDDILQGDMDFD